MARVGQSVSVLLLMIAYCWSSVSAQNGSDSTTEVPTSTTEVPTSTTEAPTPTDYPDDYYDYYDYDDPTDPQPFVAEENVNVCLQMNYGAGRIEKCS